MNKRDVYENFLIEEIFEQEDFFLEYPIIIFDQNMFHQQ